METGRIIHPEFTRKEGLWRKQYNINSSEIFLLETFVKKHSDQYNYNSFLKQNLQT